MIPHERSLVKNYKGRPFALIGVNSDKDKKGLDAKNEKRGVTWRSFWNGPKGSGGPISKAWSVRAWPTVYLIDASGVIRFKNVRGEALDKAIEKLVAEAEAAAGK